MKFLKNTKNNGSITIFISIILAAVLFLNYTLIDSAKILTAKANLSYKLTLAGKSLLTSFDRILFENYGLIALNGSEDCTLDLDYYFNGYKNTLNRSHENYINITPLSGKTTGFYTEYTESLIDINILQKQITEIMQYKTPANLLESVLEGLEILSAGDDANEGEALYNQACNYLDELSKKADELYRLVEGWSENDFACVNGFNKNLSRSITVTEIKTNAKLLSGMQFLDVDDSVLDIIKSDCTKLKADYETYAELNRRAISSINDIKLLRQKIIPCIRNIKNWLTNYKPDSETAIDYSEKLQERVDELEAILNKTEYSSVLEKLNRNIDILNENIGKMTQLYEYLNSDKSVIFSYKFIEECLSDAECKKLNTSINIYTGRGTSDTSLNDTNLTENNEVSEEDILKNIDSLIEIEKELAETLPSAIYDTNEIELYETDPLKTVLTDDYILSYFTNYTDDSLNKTSFFKAETEYILNGNLSEKKNIEYTFLKIFGIRTGLNLIHVLCDSDKRQMAISMGNAIAGATYGIGGPLYAALIMAAWASGEALIDINNLKQGETVPLIKKQEDWKLSIEGLNNISNKDHNRKDNEVFEFDYPGYLRLLLFMTPQKTKLLRIQDLIELNITEYTGSRFYLGNYYNSLSVGCKFTLKTMLKEINIKEVVNVGY